MARKLKMHLFRSSRSTWCGRSISSGTGWNESGWRPLPASAVTRDTSAVTCRMCLKADAAEQRHQDEAHAGAAKSAADSWNNK